MAKPNDYGDIISETLLSDPYVVFLVMSAMFLTDQKSTQQFYAGYPKKYSNLVLIGQVVSEETIFERKNIKTRKKRRKKVNKSNRRN